MTRDMKNTFSVYPSPSPSECSKSITRNTFFASLAICPSSPTRIYVCIVGGQYGLSTHLMVHVG